MKKMTIIATAFAAVLALSGCQELEDLSSTATPSEQGSTVNAEVAQKSNFSTDEAIKALKNMPVAQEEASGYERDEFGSAWLDVDDNGCDTRNDILQRDLKDVKFQSGDDCKVDTGVLDPGPYTGKKIDFQYGRSTSSAVQIDHVVPLSYGWKTGADKWSEDQRVEFANDPENLIATDGPANNCKSDNTLTMTMSESKFTENDSSGCDFKESDRVGETSDGEVIVQFGWMPNEAYRCTATQQIVYVLDKYDLAIKPNDKMVAEKTLAKC